MNDKRIPPYDVIYTPKVSKGFGKIFSPELIAGHVPGSENVNEVRKILKKAIGNESLYECIRQERDER